MTKTGTASFYFSSLILSSKPHIYWLGSRGVLTTNAAGTLHSTLFASKLLVFKYLENVEYLSTLHYPYIHPT